VSTQSSARVKTIVAAQKSVETSSLVTTTSKIRHQHQHQHYPRKHNSMQTTTKCGNSATPSLCPGPTEVIGDPPSSFSTSMAFDQSQIASKSTCKTNLVSKNSASTNTSKSARCKVSTEVNSESKSAMPHSSSNILDTTGKPSWNKLSSNQPLANAKSCG
jgi:hypothetical protein